MATCFIIFFLTIKSVQKRTILLYLLPKQGALYCSSGTSAASVLPYSRPSSFSPGLRPGTGVPSPTPVPAFGWDFSAQSRPSAAKLGVSFSFFRHCVWLGNVLGTTAPAQQVQRRRSLGRDPPGLDRLFVWGCTPTCRICHRIQQRAHRLRCLPRSLHPNLLMPWRIHGSDPSDHRNPRSARYPRLHPRGTPPGAHACVLRQPGCCSTLR